MTFLAYRVTEAEQGMQGQWQEQEVSALPEGDVLIEVSYSSVNYKDALSANGHKGVTRSFPHTPGIDAVGKVIESNASEYQVGDAVVVFGYDLGMNTWGGFSQKIRVPADWVLKLPKQMSEAQAMSWGTAGFTAALGVQKLLKNGITPEAGAVLVTGATGGVGSVAVALLAKLGFEVVALTGKASKLGWLLDLGAGCCIDRQEILQYQGKAMAKPLYQAAFDTVGGDMISAILPVLNHEGAIATCGMIAGVKFEASVFPFILRGVSLLGVDSVEINRDTKQAILDKVAGEWRLDSLESLTSEISRDELPATLHALLNGKGVGRYRLAIASVVKQS